VIIRKLQRISKLACCAAVLFLAWSQSCTAEQIADNALLSEAVDVYRSRIDKGKLPNVILYVIQDGKVVLSEALGWRDKAAQAKMEADTLLRMASNTKAVVATAVLILQQRRLLSIDDRVSKYLSAFDNDAHRDITIKQMLSHTSGWRFKSLFVFPLQEPSDDFPRRPNLQSEVDRLAEIVPPKEPGFSYSYNNAAYNTIGALIEKVSGRSLEQFLSSNIYEPLQMVDSSHHPPAGRLAEMSVVYGVSATSDSEQWSIRFQRDASMRVPFVRASGGMVSTAADYAKFCQMFLGQGKYQGVRILSRRSVQQATFPVTQKLYSSAERQERTSFYGLGWRVHDDESYSHTGSEGTFVWIDPSRKVVGMALSQSAGFDNPREEFRRAVTKAIDASP
jgi:CubicO group peptidase (beta-lactamase class C family)